MAGGKTTAKGTKGPASKGGPAAKDSGSKDEKGKKKQSRVQYLPSVPAKSGVKRYRTIGDLNPKERALFEAARDGKRTAVYPVKTSDKQNAKPQKAIATLNNAQLERARKIGEAALMRVALQKARAAQARREAHKKQGQRKGPKPWYTLRFRRPKTLQTPPGGGPARKVVTINHSKDHYSILRYPLNSEKAMKKMEEHNTLVFIVDLKANKPTIKAAVKAAFNVRPMKVNTLITTKGLKKAYIRLPPDVEAMDIANKIGFI